VSRESAVVAKLGLAKVGSDSFAAHRVERGAAAVHAIHAADLIAQVFGTDTLPRVVAFVSLRPQSGVTQTIAWLASEVARTTPMRCSTTSAVDYLGDNLGNARAGGAPAGRQLGPGDAQSEFDVVLVDAGDLALGGELLSLARTVDAIIVVVEAGRTRKKELTQAVSAIGAAGGNVVGLVLYRRKPLLPAWLERWIG
jgi:hypothetical protein